MTLPTVPLPLEFSVTELWRSISKEVARYVQQEKSMHSSETSSVQCLGSKIHSVIIRNYVTHQSAWEMGREVRSLSP